MEFQVKIAAALAAVALALGVVGGVSEGTLIHHERRLTIEFVTGTLPYDEKEVSSAVGQGQCVVANIACNGNREVGWLAIGPMPYTSFRTTGNLDLEAFPKIEAVAAWPNLPPAEIDGQPVDLSKPGSMICDIQADGQVAAVLLDARISKMNMGALALNEGLPGQVRFIRASTGLIGGSPGFSERGKDQPNADYAQDHARDRRKTHDVGPEGGGLLRYKIVIFAALFAALIILFSLSIREAFRLFDGHHDTTGLLALFAGVAGIFFSAIFGGLLITDLLRQTV